MALDELQQRQAESGRLAGAGLGKRHEVSVFTEKLGNHLLLHGHGVFKSQVGYGMEQFGLYAQFFK